MTAKYVQMVLQDSVFTKFFFDEKWEDYSPGTFVAVFVCPENVLPYIAVDAGDSAEILKLVLGGARFYGYGLVATSQTVSIFIHQEDVKPTPEK